VRRTRGFSGAGCALYFQQGPDYWPDYWSLISDVTTTSGRLRTQLDAAAPVPTNPALGGVCLNHGRLAKSGYLSAGIGVAELANFQMLSLKWGDRGGMQNAGLAVLVDQFCSGWQLRLWVRHGRFLLVICVVDGAIVRPLLKSEQ
jgi:hypothetical protein